MGTLLPLELLLQYIIFNLGLGLASKVSELTPAIQERPAGQSKTGLATRKELSETISLLTDMISALLNFLPYRVYIKLLLLLCTGQTDWEICK